MVVCAADPWVFLPVSPGRKQAIPQVFMREDREEYVCASHTHGLCLGW